MKVLDTLIPSVNYTGQRHSRGVSKAGASMNGRPLASSL